MSSSSFFLKIVFIYFRDGEGVRKKGRETSMCGCLSCAPCWRPGLLTQACALTGSQTWDPLVCRLELNPLSHTSQGENVFLKYFVHQLKFWLLNIWSICKTKLRFGSRDTILWYRNECFSLPIPTNATYCNLRISDARCSSHVIIQMASKSSQTLCNLGSVSLVCTLPSMPSFDPVSTP